MDIYVASSWRNNIQPVLVKVLIDCGYDVYDFRNPSKDDKGFHWSEIDNNWKLWSPEQFRDNLEHPIAQSGFAKDMTALKECDVCILVMPCGRSAHLELGYAIGQGKDSIIQLEDGEPELMYAMAKYISTSIDNTLYYLDRIAEYHNNINKWEWKSCLKYY